MKKIENIPNEIYALVLHGIDDLRYEKVKNYKLEKDKVLVKIKYCGICSSDIERIFINGTYHFPTIPGHEMSGQIVAVNDEDANLLGKKTCIFPMLPCMKCPACEKEEYAQCENYNYFGSRCDGGFSEYLLVPKWNLVLLDEKVDYKIAALCEPAAVGMHALNIGNIKENENVAIVGTGTIGILIGIFAKNKGANVSIVGRTNESLKLAKNFGLETTVIDKSNPSNKKSYDKVFEVVGSNDSINQSINITKSFGTVILVGNPKEDIIIEKNTYWKILRKQQTLKGTWNSSYNHNINDWKTVVNLMKDDSSNFEKIVTKVYTLSEYKEAFEYLRNNKEKKLKVMFKNEKS